MRRLLQIFSPLPGPKRHFTAGPHQLLPGAHIAAAAAPSSHFPLMRGFDQGESWHCGRGHFSIPLSHVCSTRSSAGPLPRQGEERGRPAGRLLMSRLGRPHGGRGVSAYGVDVSVSKLGDPALPGVSGCQQSFVGGLTSGKKKKWTRDSGPSAGTFCKRG